jgi:hypothetical protein
VAVQKTWTVSGYYVFTVPANLVGQLEVTLVGADGGRISPGAGYYPGGAGGMVHGKLNVTPTDQLELRVGGKGGNVDASGGDTTAARTPGGGGYNGGGGGGVGQPPDGRAGAGGGGCTDIRAHVAGAERLAVAGGGGGDATGLGGAEPGAPAGSHYRAGGKGGALNGGNGVSGQAGGGGGSQTAGGRGGVPFGDAAGVGGDGRSGYGGRGGSPSTYPFGGGGGGGGYFGGGGGADSVPTGSAGSGGGGSNYTGGFASVIANVQGYQQDSSPEDGSATFSWLVVPNPPTNLSPGSGQVNGTIDLPVAWRFDSDDPTDYQQLADIRWRVGTLPWNTTPNADGVHTDGHGAATWRAGTFTSVLGQSVEWQVRTYSAATATYSAWSPSSFFTPVNPPPSSFVFSPSPTLVSSSPLVGGGRSDGGPIAAFQARVLDGATVVADTGPIVLESVADAVSAVLPPYAYNNGSTYHIQARVAYPLGVWQSTWTSVDVVAAVVSPPAPTLQLTPGDGIVTVQITNPPGGVAVVANDLYRTDVVTGEEIRIATVLRPNAVYIDPLVGFGRPYRYRAVAVASTGATASSA